MEFDEVQEQMIDYCCESGVPFEWGGYMISIANSRAVQVDERDLRFRRPGTRAS